MKALHALGAVLVAVWISTTAFANEAPCCDETPAGVVVYPESDSPSWIFNRSTYSHDPYTGARVAQYMRTPPVEPLEDERMVTSRYRRSRTNLRGADGSVDTYYEVQAWGNGRGGIDAEWERFHDAWKESYLTGGYFNQGPAYAAPWWLNDAPGYGPGYGNVHPGYGYPGGWHQGPWQGGNWPGHGYGNGGHHGGGGGHHGGGNHGGGHHGGGNGGGNGDGDGDED
jgi:hypothetical protein